MQIGAPVHSSVRGPDGLRIDRLGLDRYAEVQALNRVIFGDDRVIYRTDRDDLVLLLAMVADEAVGYKVGYRETSSTFYSAKGGVLDGWRRQGVARALLDRMEAEARSLGYLTFAFDTFPNKHPGMTVLGLAEGFRVTAAGYNAAYRDYRIRFERPL
ncbi:GNAT family N-acetyltransferase [Rubrivirga marina]|uniref:GNAT family N-acetyltransferase n=1 Tax=Rubrivirga marina TaxID=1196024 RepID=A0A271J0J1_9BACT|nr:GNAT family N-acetyltransferase [Rubrivirga marina]PAP77016.1 GNAT family N-acetyltransferase [Rubrivirga marina]